MTSSRGLLAASFALFALASSRCPAADDYREMVAPFVERHCLGCHRGAKPKGDLDLTSMRNTADDLQRWELVLERLRANEMPPRDAKSHPAAEERKAVVAWIERFRADEAKRNAGDPGV